MMASKACINTFVSFLSIDTPAATMTTRDFLSSPSLTAILVSSGLCLSMANACWFSFSYKKSWQLVYYDSRTCYNFDEIWLYIAFVTMRITMIFFSKSIKDELCLFYLRGSWGHIWSMVQGRSTASGIEGPGQKARVYPYRVIACLRQDLWLKLLTLWLCHYQCQQLPPECHQLHTFLVKCRSFQWPLLPKVIRNL